MLFSMTSGSCSVSWTECSGSPVEKSDPRLICVISRSSAWGGNAGEAVADLGRGIVRAARGEPVSARCQPVDRTLCGVEFEVEDEGDDVVRVNDGVLVRESGRRKETFRNLSNGDGFHKVSLYLSLRRSGTYFRL